MCGRSDGTYEVAPASSVHRGTKVVLKLKDTCKASARCTVARCFLCAGVRVVVKGVCGVHLRNAEHAWPQEFSNSKTVEDIIIKHSNFVNFPIFLNGKQVRAVVRRGVPTAQ